METEPPTKVTGYIVAIVVALVAAIAVHTALMSGSTRPTLHAAPSLSGQAAQALTSPSTDQSPPRPGSDFELKEVNYFDNKSWAVATISPLKADMNASVIILHNKSGIFEPVRGPSTAFAPNELQDLPGDVSSYVKSKGLQYVPVLD